MKALVTILTLAALQSVSAEPEKARLSDDMLARNLVHFVAGLTSAKEEDLYPKVHTALSTRLGYRRLWPRENLQELGVGALYCRPKTGLEDLNSSILLVVDLAYSNAFPVFENQRTGVFVGPSSRLHYSLAYYPNWDESHLYWGDFLSLGGRACFTRRIRRNRNWVASVDFPLLAVYSRPDASRLYKFDDLSLSGLLRSVHEDMRFGWWSNVMYLSLRTGSEFSITPKVKHIVFYSLDYSRVKDAHGDPLQLLTHQVGLEVGW